MANIIQIKPVEGYVVTDPATMQPLPEEGASVEWSNYWQRRINEGAVELLKTTAKKGAE
ncbi:DUF2635 domain-containing protein [Neisseria subflava]|uniref:DUF2635 domain-containing protein n=1 Tax=Neisseria subflava TaxID=28449 RepID=A0A9X9I4W6_NEISU|nr:DUF2635 domain-containing protein [Neisseria subflava]